MICKECGHYHKGYRRYCEECRNKLTNHTSCIECDTTIDTEDEHCRECGAENKEFIIQKELMDKYIIEEDKRKARKKVSDNEVNKYGVRPVFIRNFPKIVLVMIGFIIMMTILIFIQV